MWFQNVLEKNAKPHQEHLNKLAGSLEVKSELFCEFFFLMFTFTCFHRYLKHNVVKFCLHCSTLYELRSNELEAVVIIVIDVAFQ